jgi:lysophospholipase
MTEDTNKKDSPDVEERFLPPQGWRWHSFKNTKGRRLRFGSVFPEDRVPEAVVIGLQGMSEFTEKYFETARDLQKLGIAFWMLDWQGQGKSERHLKNPHKRHSTTFDEDVSDLHFFIMEYVKHSAVHPDVGRIPLVMLGHSMGANIGLRYLYRHPDTFAAAAFTAPLFGINALKHLPNWMALGVTAAFQEMMDHDYVPSHGNWTEVNRKKPGKSIFSSDPIRDSIHNTWCLFDPDLQVGGVTYGWLHEANLSCAKLQKQNVLEDIKTPCLFAIPGKEKLVNNKIARKSIKHLPNAKILELPDAAHEILMESDVHRDKFFKSFIDLLKVNNVSEQLKPF